MILLYRQILKLHSRKGDSMTLAHKFSFRGNTRYYNATFKKAEEMEKDKSAAAIIRIRYLVDEHDSIDSCDCPEWMKEVYQSFVLDEILWLASSIAVVKQRTSKGGINDDDIEVARNFPIDKILDFSKGKVKAWCHDDNSPSMYHGTRTNHAICPVCNEAFDSISAYMVINECSFVQAVKGLTCS